MKKQTYALEKHEHEGTFVWRAVVTMLIVILLTLTVLFGLKIDKLEAYHTQDVEKDEWWTEVLCVKQQGVYSKEYNICFKDNSFCRVEFEERWHLKCSEARG